MLLAASSMVALSLSALPAHADQLGPQIALNPGGGLLANGSDGLRFVINADSTQSYPGADSVIYRGTNQYCCSAGAPMLNIGGTLFGQAGPAFNLSNWTSLTVLATTGSTAVGNLTSSKGNASATVRYVATKNSLQYVMERHVSYTYPNDFVTESYTFTIPEGNTEQVKFYLGGDTAPGGSDSGLGVMMTAPVRTVISLNPNSGIQFGFREMPGSKPFDGATSQSFYTPYPLVEFGQDIGFYAQPGPGVHDAGLMVQWNLGSTPGTQTASMQQFASEQGTNLTAGFDREFAVAGESVLLNASIENTHTTAAAALDFQVTLPAGTTVAPGAQSNACGGTLTAPVGGTSTTVTGAQVGGLTSCVVTVPVVATTYGTYTMSAANVTTSGGLTNNVGTSSFYVPLAPEITVTDLGTLAVGAPIDTAISSLGAPPPSFAVTAGSLPAGLTLDAETGSLTGTPTTAGPYSVTITATNAGGSDSQLFTGAVERGTSGLGGTATPSSATYGDTVTLEVSDLPASATGTVAFTSGETTLCSVTLPATSCTTSADLVPATYPVQASYNGDDNWLPRNETVTSFSVAAAATTVSGALAEHTVRYGDDVSVSASVTPAAAGGTIAVSTAGQTLCTITLPATACTIEEDLAPGTHTIALAYSGDAPRYLASSAQAGTLQINRAVPAPAPDSPVVSTYGDDIELELPGLPTAATGTVTFSIDGDELCSYELDGDAESCTVDGGRPAGDYVIDVAYSGDDNFEPITEVIDLLIEKASTSIGAPAALTGTYGQAVTVAATGVPTGATGSLTVKLGNDTLCTVAASDGSSCALPADLPAGEHSLLVSYSGDTNHLGSDAVTVVTVERAGTEISVDDVIRTDRNVAASVEVSGLPAAATGTVTIVHDEQGVLCSFDVADASSCSTPAELLPGSWELTAVYSGDANHSGSEADFTLEIARDDTQVETAATLTGTFGTATTLTVSGLPTEATGDVTVSYDEAGTTVVLCTFAVPGTSSCELPAHLPAGDHELTVDYSGDVNHKPSSSRTALEVDKLATEILAADVVTTEVGSAAEISTSGLPETATGTITVSVAPAARAAARTAARTTPAAGAVLCSFDVTEASSCETSTTIAAGTYRILVAYSGDDNHVPSQTQGRFVVEDVVTDDGDDVKPDNGGSDNGKDARDSGQLPDTGAPFAWLLAPLGLALLASGATFVYASRRRHEVL